MARYAESVIDEAKLAWLDALGYSIVHGPVVSASELGGLRDTVVPQAHFWRVVCE